jgi:hypothetical protein
VKPAFLLIALGFATQCMAAGQIQAGETQLTLPSGSVYIGTVKHGVPDGRGYFRDPDGMQYEGEVHDGRREGMAEGLFPNGDNYKGEWKNGKPDGKGMLTFANSGRRQEIWFADDKRVDAANKAEREKSFTLKEKDGPRLYQQRGISEWTFPLDIGYDRFTPEQKRAFNASYPALEDSDEPPYPLQGQRDIINVIIAVQSTFDTGGDVDVYVTVDSDGKAVSVKTIGLDSQEARKAVATAAGIIKYKPARCAGQPCRGISRICYRLGSNG